MDFYRKFLSFSQHFGGVLKYWETIVVENLY